MLDRLYPVQKKRRPETEPQEVLKVTLALMCPCHPGPHETPGSAGYRGASRHAKIYPDQCDVDHLEPLPTAFGSYVRDRECLYVRVLHERNT